MADLSNLPGASFGGDDVWGQDLNDIITAVNGDAEAALSAAAAAAAAAAAKLTKPANPSAPAVPVIAANGTVSTTLVSDLGSGTPFEPNLRGNYTAGTYALYDLFDYQGYRHLVITPFVGGATPDLTKTVVLGLSPASRVTVSFDGDTMLATLTADNGDVATVDLASFTPGDDDGGGDEDTPVWRSALDPSTLPNHHFFDDISTEPIPDKTPAGVSGFPWVRVITNDTTFFAKAWASEGSGGTPGPVLAVALRKQGYAQTRDTPLGSGSAVAGIFWRFGLDEESPATDGSLVILWRIEAGVWVTVRRVGGVPKISIYNAVADAYTDCTPTGFTWAGQSWVGGVATGFIEGGKHVFAMRLNGSTSKLWIDTQEFTFDGSGVSNATVVLGTDAAIGAGFGHSTVGQIGCAYFTVAPSATEAEVLTERNRLITLAAGMTGL